MNKIGKYTYSPTQLCVHYEDQANLIVGKYCSFGHNVNIFLGGDHRTSWCTTFPLHQLPFIKKENNQHPSTKGDVIIGNDVWVGMNAVIMSGVTIGDGAVVGAFSVVRENIEPYEIWIGNPAIHLHDRFPYDIVQELLRIKWWDWDEEVIKECCGILESKNVKDLIAFYDKRNGL